MESPQQTSSPSKRQGQVVRPTLENQMENVPSSSKSSFVLDPEANVPNRTKEEARDLNIISWDGPDDPMKPTNWPKTFRWTLITLVSAVTFVAGLSSSIFAPGVPALMEEFHTTNEILGTLVVTIYVLGLATGPLIFAPLSELYGRLVVQHIGNFGFFIWTIACALSTNMNMLIGFRLLQGVFAAVPLTNGGGVIADTVRQEERGFALAMFTLGLLAGPVIGPVCGGFLAAAKGWRWAFWISAILVPLILPLLRANQLTTYPPALGSFNNMRIRLARILPTNSPRSQNCSSPQRIR
jgi:multidrug resistance protein